MAAVDDNAIVRMVRNGVDLTTRQVGMLLLLGEEPMSPKDLAARLRLKSPVVSRNLTTLQSLDMLRVREQPDDRRRAKATLLRNGERFLAEYFGAGSG